MNNKLKPTKKHFAQVLIKEFLREKGATFSDPTMTLERSAELLHSSNDLGQFLMDKLYDISMEGLDLMAENTQLKKAVKDYAEKIQKVL